MRHPEVVVSAIPEGLLAVGCGCGWWSPWRFSLDHARANHWTHIDLDRGDLDGLYFDKYGDER